jgi:hypothetical protein
MPRSVAISSFESLSPTLAPSDWGLHAPPMSERNYALDNFVVAIANLSWPADFAGVGEADEAPYLHALGVLAASNMLVRQDLLNEDPEEIR